MNQRRFFVGDLHGCLDELEDLLEKFKFIPGQDKLYSVGDVCGKGPKVRPLLNRLKELKATVVRGNHDQALLNYSKVPSEERTSRQQMYLESLGDELQKWLFEIITWPFYLDLGDILLVHAGLAPGKDLQSTDPFILMNIRTWDGKGVDIKSESQPAWYELVSPEKTVVFGHWAKKGLIDLPSFKGLDTGCVYGRSLTGYCPEEAQLYSVPSRKVYCEIQKKA